MYGGGRGDERDGVKKCTPGNGARLTVNSLKSTFKVPSNLTELCYGKRKYKNEEGSSLKKKSVNNLVKSRSILAAIVFIWPYGFPFSSVGCCLGNVN